MIMIRSRIYITVSIGIILLFFISGLQYHFTYIRLMDNWKSWENLLNSGVLFMNAENEEMLAVLHRWKDQFYILTAVLGLLAAIAIASRSQMTHIVIIISQVILFGISLYADVYWLLSEFTLLTALMLECYIIFDVKTATWLSASLMLTLLFMPRVDTAWYYVPSVYPVDRIIGMGAGAAVIIAGLYLLHRSYLDIDKERKLSNSLKQSVFQLTSANVSFQDYAASAEERSSKEERNRITREVHDTVGYSLTNIVMMLEASKHLVENDKKKLLELLQASRDQAQNALSETRKTLKLLREETKSEPDNLLSLHNIFKTFELATNVKVQVEYRNITAVPRYMIDATVFRLVQESLTNAFRHGNATEVKVLFWYENGLSIVISDNGIGTNTVEEGIGLKGMKEQLVAVNGTVRLRSLKGKGFDIQVWIPERIETNA